MSATNNDAEDAYITHQSNESFTSNTNGAENDIPSEVGTRDSSPILNLDDWAGDDPFARPYDFVPLDANRTTGTSSIVNASEENERFQEIFADNTALEPYPPALPSRPPRALDASQRSVLTNGYIHKRGVPEESISSTSNTGESTTETEGGNGGSVSGLCLARRKKKPKGMPKRPLSAYNLYFQAQRTKIIAERKGMGDDGRGIGFEELGKIVGRLWRELGNAEKKMFEKLADKDGERYRKEMDAYHEMKIKFYEEEANRPLPGAAFPLVAATPTTDRSNVILNTGSSSNFPSPPGHRRSQSISSSSGIQHGQFAAGRGPAPEQGGPACSASFMYDVMGSAPRNGSTLQPSSEGARLSSSSPGTPTHPPMMHSHASHQGQHTIRGPPAAPSPMSLSRGDANDCGDHFPLPPGMEIVLSDRNGVDRKYRVHYQCFSMTREAAHQYMESLSGVSIPFDNAYATGNHPSSMPDLNARMPPPSVASIQDGSQPLMPPQHYNGAWRF
jgi:hypothetical protein